MINPFSRRLQLAVGSDAPGHHVEPRDRIGTVDNVRAAETSAAANW